MVAVKGAVLASLLLACLALPLARAATASATEPQAWVIDPLASQVQFSVRKFWFVHVRGTFPALSGTLRRADPDNGADLVRVDATLDVAGLRMDHPDDRSYALGAGFFDAARFPSIRFDSDPFPLDELAAGGIVRGVLYLHGEHHPVTLTLQPSDCPSQPLECVIRVHGAISRSTFGMRAWRGVLSDKVELDLRIRLTSSHFQD
jgi:polyisoprenoid-binding protein YceI